MSLLRLSLLSLSALLPACGPSGPCTPEALSEALAEAAPGQTVLVGCSMTGSFVIPAGVSLDGGGHTLTGPSELGAVLSVEGAGNTTVSHVALVVPNGLGLRAEREVALTLEDVSVDVERGIGIGLDGGGASLSGVEIHGSLLEEDALTASSDPAEAAAYGLVARGLDEATSLAVSSLHITGFTAAALLVDGGTLRWTGRATGSDVDHSRGFGALFFGTHAELHSVEVTHLYSGIGITAMGVALTVGVTQPRLEAEDLHVADGEGYGLFAHQAEVLLRASTFENLSAAGVRVQGGSLTATDLSATGNGGAGVLVIDGVVDLERAHLDAQRTASLLSQVGQVEIGDGIEVTRDPVTHPDSPPLDVRLVDVSLDGNARAGLVLDAADGPVARIVLENVSVSSSTGNGAVASRTAVSPGWDAMVTRDAFTAARDAAFPGTIDIVGIMMPPGIAPPAF